MSAYRGTLPRLASAVLGQGGISLSNLLIGVLLARALTPFDYGSYVLGMSIVLLAVGIQDSLVCIPAIVRMGRFPESTKRCHFSRIKRFAHSVGLGAACIGAVVGSIALVATGRTSDINMALAVSAAGFGWVTWDFARAEGYATSNIRQVASADTAYLAITTISVSVLYITGHLSSWIVLCTMGLAGTAAAVVAIGNDKFFESRWQRIRRIGSGLWIRGRWSFVASQATCVQSEGYIYVTTLMLSRETLATLAAARMLVAPLLTVLTAWNKAMLPRLSEAGPEVRSRLVGQSTAAFLLLVFVWEMLVLLAQDFLSQRVFLGKYPQIGNLSIFWSVAVAASGFRSICLTAARASGMFVPLARIAIVGAFATVVLCPIGVAAFGAQGALIALGAIELASGFLILNLIRRFVREKTKQP